MTNESETKPNKAASKSDTLIRLLSRPRGASLPDMMTATDWQAHSVRAFLSGLRKKGRDLAREPRRDGAMAYRIVKSAAATPAAKEGVSDA